VLIIVLICFLASGLFAVQSVKTVKANFIPPTVPPHDYDTPTIIISSPTNQTYNSSSVSLNFNITKPNSWYKDSGRGFIEYKGVIGEVSYYLDGGELVNLDVFDSMDNSSSLQFSVNLTELAEGNHTIVVSESATSYYAPDVLNNYPDYYSKYSTVLNKTDCEVNFTVVLPVNISILSPRNETYSENYIQLSIAVDKPTKWIEYSLDNQANVTILGRYTLKGISLGSHNFTVFAKDSFGNTGVSETIIFNVTSLSSQSPSPSASLSPTSSPSPIVETVPPSPFPTLQLLGTIFVIATVIAVAVVLKRRKK
jgi:hypothetical protein